MAKLLNNHELSQQIDKLWNSDQKRSNMIMSMQKRIEELEKNLNIAIEAVTIVQRALMRRTDKIAPEPGTKPYTPHMAPDFSDTDIDDSGFGDDPGS